MTDQIRYCAGYEFQLAENYSVDVGFRPLVSVSVGEWVALTDQGILSLKAGYAWDGASGPIVQSADIMRGSLVHDGLYQLMRAGLLGQEYRERADGVLKRLCIEDGMSHWLVRAGGLQRGKGVWRSGCGHRRGAVPCAHCALIGLPASAK